ncbi:CoA transferase [Alphaproteobacteria bacterium]|nr:CoA transferase [Alphaproteobacteria bacterium]
MTAFDEILNVRGAQQPASEELQTIGQDPVLNSTFKLGEVAAAAHAGVGIAVNDLWEIKTGHRQKIKINVRSAAATLKSNKFIKIQNANGDFEDLIDADHEFNRHLNGIYRTKDGRWFLPHFGLNHLRERMLGLLRADPDNASIAKAVSKWDAIELETEIEQRNLCGGMVRTNTEWLGEPHGKILSTKPVVEITKIGSSDPEPMPAGERPLSGVKALDLTRILAGPIAARTLAEHGADVLMVAAEKTPQVHAYVADTCHGKRSCFLDITEKEDANCLQDLVRKADIFSQGYRPGAMDKLGFGAEELSEIRPGLIYVSINCYGFDGPFSKRGGWEQVAQVMTGLTTENAVSEQHAVPKLLPAAANDYITGYLGAYGALLALARRAKEGGSYHVKVSLCQTAMMIYRNGKIEDGSIPEELSPDEIAALTCETNTHLGLAKHLSPILQLSETSPFWALPTPKLNANAAEWLSA